MSLRFPYQRYSSPHPLVSLSGRKNRPRSVISVTLIGPSGSMPQDALLDTGADDTIFPESVAAKLGIDLLELNRLVEEAGLDREDVIFDLQSPAGVDSAL